MSYTPEVVIDCGVTTWSHPVTSTGFGDPVAYVVSVNGGEKTDYAPGDVIEVPTEDGAQWNVTLWARYDGMGFDHQLGQSKQYPAVCEIEPPVVEPEIPVKETPVEEVPVEEAPVEIPVEETPPVEDAFVVAPTDTIIEAPTVVEELATPAEAITETMQPVAPHKVDAGIPASPDAFTGIALLVAVAMSGIVVLGKRVLGL